MSALTEGRDRLDALDRALVELLAERAAVVRALADHKRAVGAPFRDPAREEAVLRAVSAHASTRGLDPARVREVFAHVVGRELDRPGSSGGRGVLVLRRPGHGPAGPAEAAALAALAASVGGRVESRRVVVVLAGPDEAVELALRALSAHPGAAAAVGEGEITWAAGSPVGGAAERTSQLADLARVGEVLLPASLVVTVPDGVGAFAAPAALGALVGFAVRTLRDHRS